MIRTKNTYYDNIERMVVQKWILQTAAQSGLPEWLKYEYLEICLCELMKCKWKQPFNRYAWIVEREIAKSDIQYCSDHCVILGHVFSMMAWILMLATGEEQQF